MVTVIRGKRPLTVQGGFAVAENGRVIDILPLPIGGIISEPSVNETAERLRQLHEAARKIGCTLDDPFLQLAFLSLPVIPFLKLTDKGLVDVEQYRIIGT